MDKLRKLGFLLWQNKERMVLVFLVAVLAYRVYKVMTETEEESPSIYNAGGASNPEPSPPDSPPAAPDSGTTTENYQSLSQRNPFWYYGARTESAATQGTSVEDDIRLLNIQRGPRGRYAAQIQTRDTKWYQEGEEFESYKVLKIDPATRSVEVYSGKSGTTLMLTM